MAELKNVCVYCGSAKGGNPAYLQAARALGIALAREKIRLVYGGGGVGMMGEVARAAEDAGGKVLGIIPDFLVAREHAAQGAREIVTVRGMHERKRTMFERADAFVALPGGFGTLDEFCEVLTWAQLGIHDKPCGLVNIGGYFDGLLAQVATAVAGGRTRREHRDLVFVSADPEDLLSQLRAHRPVLLSKWLDTEAR